MKRRLTSWEMRNGWTQMRKVQHHYLLCMWKMVWSSYNSLRYLLFISHNRNGPREKIDISLIEVRDLERSSYVCFFSNPIEFFCSVFAASK